MDVVSTCPLQVAKQLWLAGHGVSALTVVVKATFELAPDLSPLAATQEPVCEADEYAGEHGSLTRATELSPLKRHPELLLTGHAFAPDGHPTRSFVARVAIGEIDKAIDVVGDRYFQMDGELGEPAKLTQMPLVWERAAGGPDTSNPAGVPTGEAARPDFFGRVPTPNLYPAGVSLTSRADVIPPANFGPVSPRWPSRMLRLNQHAAGWDVARWHEKPLPGGVDVAYFNAAPTDQQRHLPFGDDTLYLENLHPRFPRLSTRFAPVAPIAAIDYGGGAVKPLVLRCDTLTIDTDRGIATLLFRTHVLLDPSVRGARIVVGEASARGRSSVPTPAAGMPRVVVSPPRPSSPPTSMPEGTANTVPAWAHSVKNPRQTVTLTGVNIPGHDPSAGELPFTSTGSFRPVVAPPSAPAPSMPVPSMSVPSMPAPSAPPTFGAPPPSAPVASAPAPSMPVPSMPVPSAPPTFGAPPPNVPVAESKVGFRRAVTTIADQSAGPVLPFEDRAASSHPAAPSPDSDARGAPSVAASETPTLTSTGSLPFRPTMGARVGGSALGRSMKLGAKPEEPPPPPPITAPSPATFDDEPDTERPRPAPTPPLAPVAWAPPPSFAPVTPPGPVAPPSPVTWTSFDSAPAVTPALTPESPPVFVPPPTATGAGAPALYLGPLAPPADSPLPATPAVAASTDSPEQASTAAAVTAPETAAPDAPATPPFDDYPPARCGAIAARIACEPAAETDILQAEALDSRTWPLVHDHWLQAMRAAAARRDKKLLSDYDHAYLATLEEKRGPIALDDYARIAEAAERGEQVKPLTERQLPEAAWPHLQRVWIERMVKDMQLAGLVRRALNACRSATA